MAEDTYLAISQIANDEVMVRRMYAAVTQQSNLESISLGNINVTTWVDYNRYLWAGSPGWGAAWAYALESNPDDPDYNPGEDSAVITDAMILSAVQELLGSET